LAPGEIHEDLASELLRDLAGRPPRCIRVLSLNRDSGLREETVTLVRFLAVDKINDDDALEISG
jgi:hypothetical protein